MTICSTAKRTLVKSPPELWSELSDPAALARQLSDFGEVQIVEMQPEKLIEWAGQRATGTIELAASGWGTKVTLTAVQQQVPVETATPVEQVTPTAERAPTEASLPLEEEPDIEADEGPRPDPDPPLDPDPQPDPIAAEAPVEESDREPLAVDASLEEEPPTLERRRGFLERLFGRRKSRRAPAAPQSTSTSMSTSTSETDAKPDPETPIEEQPDIAAELLAIEQAPEPPPLAAESDMAEELEDSAPSVAEELAATEALVAAQQLAAEQATAVLTSVLDRLGAAHHRPFSRA